MLEDKSPYSSRCTEVNLAIREVSVYLSLYFSTEIPYDQESYGNIGALLRDPG